MQSKALFPGVGGGFDPERRARVLLPPCKYSAFVRVKNFGGVSSVWLPKFCEYVE